MHDLLFAHQHNVKLPDLLGYARQLHLNMPLFQKRLESGYYKAAIEQDLAMAEAVGVEGTPTFFINGEKLIGAQSAERLQGMIAGKPGPEVANADVSSLNLANSPVRGASVAPVTIIEFSDLQCPFCARVVPTIQQVLEQYPSEVKWIFKNYPLDFHTDSPLAHQAVLAAGEQGKFWEMHDLVFAGQPAIKRDDLLQKARSLNLDMARFTADLDSEKIKRQIENDKREGAALGVSGTPSFFINGKEYSGAMPLEQFKAIINGELALKPAQAALGTVAKVQADPEVSLGPASAPVTLVWFSDLQSNLTVKATLLIRQIMKDHPGKVRLVFKNRPLDSHPDSMLLHEAAMAANAQGKFWEMHDLIIAAPQKTAKQDLIAYAQRIGLDVKRFESELDSNKYRPSVMKDLDEAKRRAVLGTPVFFLNTTRIDGLQPQKAFEELITAQPPQPVQVGSR
jgi:protein-disulfide isomerase